ncbi:MAG: hypothetical protein C0507_12830 [Cyanobacteria bacterium PR.3.49]|nr:hypothetical protein [Cyanobacteria bacterium PR.3.49]
MPENQTAQASTSSPVSALEFYGKTIKELPSATAELASEAWEKPGQAMGHAVKTVGTSAMIGTLMGYILPAKGPTAWAVGIGLTVPLIYSGYKAITGATEAAQLPGANPDYVARQLARSTVSGSTDFVLNMAGGLGGVEGGYAIKSNAGKVGRFGQTAQRSILEAENKFLSTIANNKYVRQISEPGINPKLPVGVIHTTGGAEGANVIRLSSFDTEALLPQHVSWFKRSFTSLSERIRQYDNRDVVTTIGPRIARIEDDYMLAQGSLHVHTKQSDGMGTVTSISEKAKAGKQNVVLFSDHNHLAARDGVKPGDPRIPDQDVPVIAELPKWYAQQFQEAAEQTVNGKYVAIIGTEMGTIGKVGNPKSGGKNHFLMVDVPQFFEAKRRPHTVLDTAFAPLRRALGLKEKPAVVEPQVVEYNDGNMNALVTYISQNRIKDTTGQDPIFIMAHPRWSQDHSPSLPSGTKGADYGRYSFKTKAEWVQRTDKHFRGIEVIKGQAMKQSDTAEVGSKDVDLLSLRGYLNEGFHVSPTVGRDAHFGNPLGTPAETGIWTSAIDKPSVLEAMRARRTFATTHMERLNGRVVANDRYQMGQVLDQAVTNELKLTTQIGGKVEPEAQYTFKLWADEKVGDRTLAQVVQQQKLTGEELRQMGNAFSFEKFRHTLGNKGGAYFVEVSRKDPTTAHMDRMFMAPFWVEPLSGGGRHSLWLPFLAGQAPSTLMPAGS